MVFKTNAKVKADTLNMTNMQIAIWFRRETSQYSAIGVHIIFNILIDFCLYKIRSFNFCIHFCSSQYE